MNDPPSIRARGEAITARLEVFARGFVGLGAAATLGASVYLFVFSQPFADDFCIGRDVSRLGPLGGLTAVLSGNSSRWAGKAVEYILHSLLDMTSAYAISLVLIRSIFIGSLYLLLKACLRDSHRREVAFLTVLLATAYFVGMKDPAQTWYWLPGAVEYDLGFSVMLLALAVLRRGLELGHTRRVWWSIPILLAASGFHELIGLLAAGLLGLACCVARPATRWRIVVAFLAALTGSGILLLVPGGWNRMGATENRGALESLHLGLTQAGGNLLEWMFQPSLLLLWAAVLLGLIRLDFSRSLSAGTTRSAVVAVIAWLAGSLGLFLVAALAGGKTAPYRTVNLAYLWFALGSIYLAAVVARRWRAECGGVPSLILLVLLGCSFPLTGHGRSLWHDLFSRAPEFSRRSAAHFAELSSATRFEDRVVIELDNRRLPRLFYTSGLATEDPAHWHNRCIADYFDVREVQLRLGDPGHRLPGTNRPRRQVQQTPASTRGGGGDR